MSPSGKRPPNRPARDRDAAEEVALVATARRELLLRTHRHRLRPEDLEDCFGQATLELIAYVRKGGTFAGRRHIANTLEVRFLSRVRDRWRALGGRSPIQTALGLASPLGDAELEIDVADMRADPETLVMLREELSQIKRFARMLTLEQRVVLYSQVAQQMPPAVFCKRFGWSQNKYRKVSQRARERLRDLTGREPQIGVTSRTSGRNRGGTRP